MNKKRQEKKQKEREKLNKKRILEKRLRDRKVANAAKKIDKTSRIRGVPIINDPAKKEEYVKKQLERNMKILEALEEEYNKDQLSRDSLNKVLEEEGYITLQEKMDALNDKAMQGTISQEDIDKFVKFQEEAAEVDEIKKRIQAKSDVIEDFLDDKIPDSACDLTPEPQNTIVVTPDATTSTTYSVDANIKGGKLISGAQFAPKKKKFSGSAECCIVKRNEVPEEAEKKRLK